jgi:hypothetical protein
MDQRLQFLSSFQKEEMSVADLCRRLWDLASHGLPLDQPLQRGVPEGLVDQSSRPH